MKTLQGTIISTKMQKTVVVAVERPTQHPVYKKIIKRVKKYKADPGSLEPKEGDRVIIKETKPISKEKHWIVEHVTT